jgi:hypothetical protein
MEHPCPSGRAFQIFYDPFSEMRISGMSNDEPLNEGPLQYAVREYRRLYEEARTGQRPWDEEATLRALAEKTHVTVEELRAAISSSSRT